MLKISESNARAFISGITGPYGKQTVHEGAEFGMNAMAEYRKYNKKLGSPLATEDMYNGRDYKITSISSGKKSERGLGSFLDNLMPANFTLKYMPVTNGKFDMMALVGAAFERLGLAASRPVNEMKMPSFINFATLEAFTNKEGCIDLEKEAARVLMLDMASAHKKPIEEIFEKDLHLEATDITGIINEFGQRNVDFAYYDKRGLDVTKSMVNDIAKFLKIPEAVKDFKEFMKLK